MRNCFFELRNIEAVCIRLSLIVGDKATILMFKF